MRPLSSAVRVSLDRRRRPLGDRGREVEMDGGARATRQLRRCIATVCVPLCTTIVASDRGGPSAQSRDKPAQVSVWPCRLIVKPTLLGAIEDGFRRSATLQRQCRELAELRAIVALEWGKTDSQSRAISRMNFAEHGILVAKIVIPPVSEAIELVAHELEHVIEKARGVDFEAESRRRGSGVWRASGGFETQRAIDAGRQVPKELRETRK
jgi:hypothetical protein